MKYDQDTFDGSLFCVEKEARKICWGEVFRVAKPGSYLLVVDESGSWYRRAAALEEAGWELVDEIMWLKESSKTPVLVAQNPRSGTYANNVDKYDIAGYNIDGGRVDNSIDSYKKTNRGAKKAHIYNGGFKNDDTASANPEGRYPTNLICSSAARQDLEPKAHDENGDFFFYTADERRTFLQYLANLIVPPPREISQRRLFTSCTYLEDMNKIWDSVELYSTKKDEQ